MAKDVRPLGHHPVSSAVGRLREEVSRLAEVPLWSMDASETAATLTHLTALAAQVAELELRVAAHAGSVSVGQQSGASSTAVWWASVTNQDRGAACGRMRLAEALDRYALVRDGLAAGDVTIEQARVIVQACDRLPDDLEPSVVAEAERVLVGYAADHCPKTLRVLGKSILAVVAPEVGEAADARALEREEREAAASAWLTMCDDGHGSTVGKFKIPALAGGMLKKALLAIAAPKHQTSVHGADSYERKPSRERLGAAFTEYVERYPTDRLPETGGLAATVVVTMTLDSLLGGLHHAQLDTGSVISASLARRMACEAGVIPAVLGSQSEVLDLGRKTRLFTGPQRQALNLRQPTCSAEGCDWPAYLCHAHHDTAWSAGGRTDVANGQNLCPHHHARIHDSAYSTRRQSGGSITFHRRT